MSITIYTGTIKIKKKLLKYMLMKWINYYLNPLDFLVYVHYNVRILEKGGVNMTNTNITNLRKNLFDYINQAIEYGDVINVSAKNGNAVIISEAEYNSLIETLYLSQDPKVKQDILDGLSTPLSDCVDADGVEW